MSKPKALIILLIVILIAGLIALAGSQNGQTFNYTPIFILCVSWAFLLNWIAFIPAYLQQTEKFYDLIGSATYITVTFLALYLADNHNNLIYLIAGVVLIWSLRLGSFLYKRIHRSGKDDRFDSIKPDAFRFFNAWSIQALWVVITAAPAFVAISSQNRLDINIYTYIGLAFWIIGFSIEVIADNQKTAFKKVASNEGKFINTGLWSKSRHPNYFGEIVLWIGVSIMAFPILQGWQYIALISPVFVTFLLTKVSGLPMLEAKADKKWGGQSDYEEYKKNTPVLIPKYFS